MLPFPIIPFVTCADTITFPSVEEEGEYEEEVAPEEE